MRKNLFDYIKENIKISDFVRTLEQTKGLHLTGRDEYRCNNVIAQGNGVTSMRIKDDEGYFKVFSHGQEGGDIITLYQLTLGKGESPYNSALGLASHMGLAIPDEYKQQSYTSKQSITDTLNTVSKRLHKYLLTSQNEDAQKVRKYLRERGVTKDIVVEWELGLFPSDKTVCWDLVTKDIDRKLLVKANLLDKDGRYIPMTGRVSFPIFSKKGDVLAFSSRQVPGVHCLNEKSKYINTSTTEVFNKSVNLYGQHLIGSGAKNIIICEGNLDVIALNEVVDEDTVALATCGTALTESHIPLLKSVGAENYTILFDSDEAGVNSTLKLVWLTNHLPFVSISKVVGGKDPWDGFIAGEDILSGVQYDKSIVWESPYLAVRAYDGEGFISWFKRTHELLVYSSDREDLMSNAVKFSGMRKAALQNSLVGVKKKTIHRRGNASTRSFSDSTEMLVSALLSIPDMEERRFISFSLLGKQKEKILSILGIDNEEEEAISLALGNKIHRTDELVDSVYSLSPEPGEGEERAIEDFCRLFATKITSLWREESPPQGSFAFFTPLSMIASGSSPIPPKDKMSFLFDVVAV